MRDYVCEFTVRFVPLPDDRRAAYEHAINLLADWELAEEASPSEEATLATELFGYSIAEKENA